MPGENDRSSADRVPGTKRFRVPNCCQHMEGNRPSQCARHPLPVWCPPASGIINGLTGVSSLNTLGHDRSACSGSRRRKVGPHRQQPPAPAEWVDIDNMMLPVAVVIVRTANWDSYDGSRRNQSASSGLARSPTSLGQDLLPTTAHEGLALARQRALLPSRVDCDVGKQLILACGRGIITDLEATKQGRSFALQGIRSALC